MILLDLFIYSKIAAAKRDGSTKTHSISFIISSKVIKSFWKKRLVKYKNLLYLGIRREERKKG